MEKKLPRVIEEVGFDFSWDNRKVWELDIPIEDMDISGLEWHFDIPFWNKPGGYYDLKPNEVLNNPDTYKHEFERTMNADMTYPLDIMFWRDRWLLLDGLHRLVKAAHLREKQVRVRKVSQEHIPDIKKGTK